MKLTDDEAKVIALILHEIARDTGEDLMGVFLKATGHRILDGQGIVDLAKKVEGVLVGQPCYACNGEGVHCPGKGYEHECSTCDGTGKLTKFVEDVNGRADDGDRW